MLNDNPLDEVNYIKFLGMYVDKSLTWNEQINMICNKISSGIYVLRMLSKHCKSKVLKMAYYGLIYPYISYGIMFWGSCSEKEFNRIFVLQKKAVRIIGNLKFRETCVNAFKQLDIMTLPCIYIQETIQFFLYNCVIFTGNDVHNYNTRKGFQYRPQQHRLNLFTNLPESSGVHLFNKLPEELKIIHNKQQFKSKLKQFLLSNAFYSVEEYLDQ